MKKPRPQSDGAAAAPPLRAGWAEAARRMHAAGDDRLLDPPQSSTFDDQEWEGSGGPTPTRAAPTPAYRGPDVRGGVFPPPPPGRGNESRVSQFGKQREIPINMASTGEADAYSPLTSPMAP